MASGRRLSRRRRRAHVLPERGRGRHRSRPAGGRAGGHPRAGRGRSQTGRAPTRGAIALGPDQDPGGPPFDLRTRRRSLRPRLPREPEPDHHPGGEAVLREGVDARRVRLLGRQAGGTQVAGGRRRSAEGRDRVHQPGQPVRTGGQVQGRAGPNHAHPVEGRQDPQEPGAATVAISVAGGSGGRCMQVVIVALVAAVIGILLGLLSPVTIPIGYARYTAVALLAGLDSIFGAFKAYIAGSYEPRVFVTGLVTNMARAGGLTFVGDKIGVDLSIAAIVAFGVRIFNNFASIRRHYLRSGVNVGRDGV